MSNRRSGLCGLTYRSYGRTVVRIISNEHSGVRKVLLAFWRQQFYAKSISAFSARFRATLFTRNLCYKDYKSAFVIFVSTPRSGDELNSHHQCTQLDGYADSQGTEVDLSSGQQLSPHSEASSNSEQSAEDAILDLDYTK
eukprot:COSAG02_NODE_20523_length_827_cov_1.282967_1_plen_140_part_00